MSNIERIPTPLINRIHLLDRIASGPGGGAGASGGGCSGRSIVRSIFLRAVSCAR